MYTAFGDAVRNEHFVACAVWRLGHWAPASHSNTRWRKCAEVTKAKVRCTFLSQRADTDLTTLGDEFFADCPYIEEIAFFALATVQHVGNHWLSNCPSLRNVDFGGTVVEGDELRWYRSSEAHRGRHCLASVGDFWLADCTNLVTVNFSSMYHLRLVGNNWLSRCTSLTEIHFRLPELRMVGSHWLLACSNLVSVHIEALPHLSLVEHGWLQLCESLQLLSFESPDGATLPSLERVGNDWLQGCAALRQVDFGDMTSLRVVGDQWMESCSALVSVNVTGMNSLAWVGRNWLRCCSSLEHFTTTTTPLFTTTKKLPSGDVDLVDSQRLAIPCLSKLVFVGNSWLRDCFLLRSADFRGAPALDSVGESWLRDCDVLDTVRFGGLRALHTIGVDMMKGCYRILHLDIENVVALGDGDGNCRGVLPIWLQRSPPVSFGFNFSP